jgi:hypothetical protein
MEMTMSEQTIPMVASSPRIGLLGATRAAITQMVAAIQASRQRRAERAVRTILRDFSVERLAAYGWSAEDIQYLKSM